MELSFHHNPGLNFLKLLKGLLQLVEGMGFEISSSNVSMAESEELELFVTPGPASCGLPQNPTIQQRRCWDIQELFLAKYGRMGKKNRTAEAVGISVQAVEAWQARDLYGFNKRMADAHQRYVESLEAEMDETIKSRPVATQVLQIFRLKAEWPEKYREEVKVVGIEASKQMMDKLRELAARDRERAALEAPAVEGVYKEVAQPQQESVGMPPPAPPGPPARESAKDKRAAQVKTGRAARAKPSGRMIRR
jgi:hypothetical protein